MKEDNFPYIAPCPDCVGCGVHWYNPDFPMADSGRRSMEPCFTCQGRGRIIPTEWLKG